jgi:hypothetical protein
MEIFLKALEKVFAESDSDRFETATALWENLSHDMRYSLEVDQGNMDNFSRIFTRAIVDKHHVTPIPESEVKAICWKMVGALTAKENKWGTSNPNQKFRQEFEAALKNDREFEQLPTVERFLFICEELVHKWELMFHDVNSRKGKRAQSEADQLAEQSKSKKSAPNPGVPLLSATVGDHCDGCDKRNHHRRDCLSGEPARTMEG